MANEISAALTLTIANGNFSESFSPSATIDQATAGGGLPGTITAALSGGTSVTLTDMTSPGLVYMKNLSPLYNVVYGPDSTGLVDFGKLKPGEFAFFRLEPSVTMIVETSSGVAAEVQIMVFED